MIVPANDIVNGQTWPNRRGQGWFDLTRKESTEDERASVGAACRVLRDDGRRRTEQTLIGTGSVIRTEAGWMERTHGRDHSSTIQTLSDLKQKRKKG